MKNLLLVTLALTVILLSSCKKDEASTNSDDLSGTSWRSENMGTTNQPEYNMLKFTSKTAVEMLYKAYGQQSYTLEDKGTYSITGIKINIAMQSFTISGVIEGNIINLHDTPNVDWLFYKQ